MKRTIAVGLALAVALLGQVAPSMAQDYGRDYNRGDNSRGDYNNRGDYNQGRWGNGTIGLDDLEGRWVARRGGYGLPSANRYGSSVMNAGLPPRMVIDQQRNVIRVENFRGQVLQQIVLGDRRGAYRGGYVFGQWRDNKLMTVRTGDYNTRIIQTFALANRGRTLMVTTRQDGPGTRHDVEFTNVYQRA